MATNEFTTLGANAGDFKRNAFGARLWRCDGCGKEEPWGPTWSWFGKQCRGVSWYDNGIMEWCACSQECAKKKGDHGA